MKCLRGINVLVLTHTSWHKVIKELTFSVISGGAFTGLNSYYFEISHHHDINIVKNNFSTHKRLLLMRYSDGEMSSEAHWCIDFSFKGV